MTTWLLSMAMLAEPRLPACTEPVTRLYEERQFVAAARAAESCWARTGSDVLLFFAAQARDGAGEPTRAVLHLEVYLSRLPSKAPQRPRAERMLEELRAKTVEVTVVAPPTTLVLLLAGRDEQLVLPWAGGRRSVRLEPGTWRVWLSGEGPDQARTFSATAGAEVDVSPMVALRMPRSFTVDVRVSPWRKGRLALRRGETPELRELPLGAERTTVMLEEGRWEVVARVPGREPVRAEVAIVGPTAVTLTPRRGRAHQARVGLAVGLGAASLALFSWGGAWVARGGATYSRWSEVVGVDAAGRALDGYVRRLDGLLVLGTGLGALAVATTNGFGARRKALIVEAGVGGGLLLGGAIAVGVLADVPKTLAAEPVDGVAAATLGVGVGLLGGSVTSLVTWTLIAKNRGATRRVEPYAGPRGVGLRGSF